MMFNVVKQYICTILVDSGNLFKWHLNSIQMSRDYIINSVTWMIIDLPVMQSTW